MFVGTEASRFSKNTSEDVILDLLPILWHYTGQIIDQLAIIKMANNVNGAQEKFELMNEIRCLSM